MPSWWPNSSELYHFIHELQVFAVALVALTAAIVAFIGTTAAAFINHNSALNSVRLAKNYERIRQVETDRLEADALRVHVGVTYIKIGELLKRRSDLNKSLLDYNLGMFCETFLSLADIGDRTGLGAIPYKDVKLIDGEISSCSDSADLTAVLEAAYTDFQDAS